MTGLRRTAARIGAVVLTTLLTGTVIAATAQAGQPDSLRSARDGKPSPTASAAPDDPLDSGVDAIGKRSDDQSRGTRGRGIVSFGLRPAGATTVDLRTTWTYQKLVPGQVVNDHLGIVNLSDQPTTFTVYAADGRNTSSGGFTVAPNKLSSLDVGTWIAVAKSVVTVPARSTVVMPFRLVVPKRVEPGDHAGGIVASFRTYAKNAQGNTVAVDSRVGSRVYARVVGALLPRLQIERLDTTFDPGGVLSKGAATVAFTVRNAGNVRLLGRQSVRISDLFGSQATAESVPDLPELLPGNSFTFNVRVRGLVPVSYFTAQVTVDPMSVTGNVDPALAQAVAARSFLGLSYPLLGLLLVILLAAAWPIWRWWRSSHPRTPRRPASAAATPPAAANRPAATSPVSGASVRARVRLLAGLAGLATAALALGLALSALPAQAASGADGSLTFVPAKGQDIDPMYAVLSGPCPAGATHSVGVLTGKGFPAEGINVIPSSQAGMRHDEAFGLPLQNSLKNFASMNGVKLQGAYTLTVRCVDRLATKTFATFAGTITFADPQHYTAKAPATPPNYGVPVAVLGGTFPELSAAPQPPPTVAGSAGAQPVPSPGQSLPAAAGPVGSADASVPASAVAGATPASATPVPAPGDSGGGGSSAAWGVVAALAAIGGVSLMAARRRRRSVPEATSAVTTWPDQERV